VCCLQLPAQGPWGSPGERCLQLSTDSLGLDLAVQAEAGVYTSEGRVLLEAFRNLVSFALQSVGTYFQILLS